MRYILLLIALAIPACSFAQTQKDYEHRVDRFMKFYNANQPDSICNQYADDWGELKKTLWTSERNNALQKEYGIMKSYRFLELYRGGNGDGGGDGLAFFKVVFTKSTHIMGITLNKKNEILTFRFKTSSPHIDSLLAKNTN